MSDNFTEAEKTFVTAELARLGHVGCTVEESGIQYVQHGRPLRVDELDQLNRDFADVRARVLAARHEPGAIVNVLSKDKSPEVQRWLADHARSNEHKDQDHMRDVYREVLTYGTPKPPTPISGYRRLTDEDHALMNELKAAVNAYGAILTRMKGDPTLDQRWLAMAVTDAQTSCMKACRAVAQPGGFA